MKAKYQKIESLNDLRINYDFFVDNMLYTLNQEDGDMVTKERIYELLDDYAGELYVAQTMLERDYFLDDYHKKLVTDLIEGAIVE